MIKIPKIIHIIWIGSKRFPYSRWKLTYERLNPTWEIKFWTNGKIPKLINQKAFIKANSWAAKADILRLELLYKYGGIYIDADSKCLKSLDSLIDNMTCFGMTGNHGNVANGTIGCTKNHQAFKELVYNLDKHLKYLKTLDVNKKYGISIFNIAGTGYITKILRKYPDFIQIDKGLKKKTRKLIGTFKDKEVLKSGYIVHKNAKSWKTKKTRRVKL
jgi:mannosyltransferase OCH1-like enzyme